MPGGALVSWAAYGGLLSMVKNVVCAASAHRPRHRVVARERRTLQPQAKHKSPGGGRSRMFRLACSSGMIDVQRTLRELNGREPIGAARQSSPCQRLDDARFR